MTLHTLKSFDEAQFADMIHLYEIDLGQDDFDLEFEDITEVDLPMSPCKYETETEKECNYTKTEDSCSSPCSEKEIVFNDIACFKGQDLDSIDESALNSLFREMPLLDLEEYLDEEAGWGTDSSEYCIIECNRCHRKFHDRRQFLSHSGPCFKRHIIEYTCTTCSKSFTRYLLFRVHCLRHVPEKHVCIFCEGEFKLQSALVSHISSAHSSFYPYTCKECGLLCPSENLLSHHEKKNHLNKGYACNICNRVLFLKKNLIRHIRVHNSGKLYMCDACGKLFLYKTSLMHHLANIHASNTPHQCIHCGKRFAEEAFLKRHMKLHTEKRPFVCTVCAKSFKTNAALNTHLLTHEYNKRFVCSKCNKGFTKISKLKEHENIHTGERPFQCRFCLRSFTNSPNMLKHVKRMHFGKKIVSKQRNKKIRNSQPEFSISLQL